MNFRDAWHIQQSEKQGVMAPLWLCPDLTMIINSIVSIIRRKGGNRSFWLKGHERSVESEKNYFNSANIK